MSAAGRGAVLIAVPVYKPVLDADEEISWRQLQHVLGHHEIGVFLPESLASPLRGVRLFRFPDAYFTSVDAYSRLLLSPEFYLRFADYDYLLIHQLDALVLADQLAAWCAAGYDYLGAPWLVSPEEPTLGFSRVGNGGFSLRRVAAALAVLESGRYVREPVPLWQDLFRAPLPDFRRGVHDLWQRLRVLREARRGVRWYAASYTLNEDRFWSDRARLFYPDFRIAPVEDALGFAFERAPRYCFERRGGQLPFGGHAWTRFDRAFWEEHALTQPR